MGREEELLVRVKLHGLGDDAELHGLQVLRTFRDDDDVSSVLTLHGFSQSSCRHERVIDHQTVIVDEQNIDAWLHIAVLEGVVEEDDVNAFDAFPVGQFVDASCTFSIHSHRDVGELGLHLIGLVTDVVDRRVLIGQHKPVTLSFVAPTQHSYLRMVFQQSYEVFHMGCLACATNSDVTHGDDRNGEGTAFQDAHLEEQVPEADTEPVEPAQRQ